MSKSNKETRHISKKVPSLKELGVDNIEQLVFNAISISVLVVYQDILIDLNSHALESLGYSNKKQLIGKMPSDISPKEQKDGVSSEWLSKRYNDRALMLSLIHI